MSQNQFGNSSQNPYQPSQQFGFQPPPDKPPGQPRSEGLAITSMVLGIVGLLSVCCCTLLSGPLGIAATITGFIGLSKANDGSAGGKGMAVAGVVLGIITILLTIASVILGVAMQGDQWQKMLEEMQQQR